MIATINKQQLLRLKDELIQAIYIVNNQKQRETPKFLSYLNVMKKNIETCIDCDYDGLEELVGYLCDDWTMACKVDYGLGTWYVKDDNIDIKATENRKFDQAIIEIDKILQTNHIMARTWYDSNDLHNIGLSFNKCKNDWDTMINDIINKYGLIKSEIAVIPDDIWTYAKYLSIASDNNSLINWFSKEIPGFGYLAPLEIVKLVNGENILRSFMMDITI
ncbi:hypothetical protein [Pseudobacteroides cellulosolvens]|uniref:Uncharacterized protein n=1 Tax=Pseudobacteroides cellulosolvens ATCC 35603 = DSM 2933 TaxID=398512 RepID=A0A0L6JX90_9FIRM|nr:hypothetical protein [Pseudobacteroides cellulosolvens]KNY30471.1 hypothetical protein Bccel_5751 [Pseudobacteroides cellulosolvens ATCC 35603 = DSM 2933]KNY30478.1 hypothetical protein Bccel_5758 [Pseudobacteroides cellulosolvens ATCC 35603 = DSM 2933]